MEISKVSQVPNYMIFEGGYYLVDAQPGCSPFNPPRSVAASTHPEEWRARDKSLLCASAPMLTVLGDILSLPADGRGNVAIDKSIVDRIRGIVDDVSQKRYPVLEF